MITAETCRSISYPLPIKLNENYTTFLKNSNCHKHFQQNLYCLRSLDDVKYQKLSLNSKLQHHVQYRNFSSKPSKRYKFVSALCRWINAETIPTLQPLDPKPGSRWSAGALDTYKNYNRRTPKF